MRDENNTQSARAEDHAGGKIFSRVTYFLNSNAIDRDGVGHHGLTHWTPIIECDMVKRGHYHADEERAYQFHLHK
jgi:hypothetical protein